MSLRPTLFQPDNIADLYPGESTHSYFDFKALYGLPPPQQREVRLQPGLPEAAAAPSGMW